ncbi:MAG TPA: hypothetical protein VHN98_05145 [Acidimicrobiales bacterium]|nr:hypothetical protein [Acidimicrobiales bacterium]
MDEAPTHGHGAQPVRRPPSRRVLALVLVPIVVMTALAYVGDIAAAGLVERHPLWLIALNTRKRYLALVVPHTDALSFYVVGTLRQLLSDPFFYLIGIWYGDAGVRWLERKLGDGGLLVTWMERGFMKAAWPMVALFPNSLICMLAGASGMPAWLFLLLNVGGTVVSMVVLRAFGDVFSSPLAAVTHFLDHYRWPIIAVSAVLVGINVVLNRRKGTSELESISSLERELEEAADDDAG